MKYTKHTALITSILLSTLLIGCGGNNEPTVAKVGDQEITKQYFESYLKHKNIPKDDETKYQRALDAYLERSALTAAIEQSNKLDMNAINTEVEEFKKQALISRYFESFLKDSASDDSIRNYYSANAGQYQSTKAHVAHILFRVNSKMDETERQVILTTAHEAYSKLQSGEDFSSIAQKYSEDTVSAKKGGDLGWINRGAVAPEFSEKSFSLPVGEISEPFLTSFGFHILKVLEAPQIVKKPFEAVKGDIRYQLRSEAKNAEQSRLLDSISIVKK
jgi:peptidyl-prolyl cis-trans isomerase C